MISINHLPIIIILLDAINPADEARNTIVRVLCKPDDKREIIETGAGRGEKGEESGEGLWGQSGKRGGLGENSQSVRDDFRANGQNEGCWGENATKMWECDVMIDPESRNRDISSQQGCLNQDGLQFTMENKKVGCVNWDFRNRDREDIMCNGGFWLDPVSDDLKTKQ